MELKRETLTLDPEGRSRQDFLKLAGSIIDEKGLDSAIYHLYDCYHRSPAFYIPLSGMDEVAQDAVLESIKSHIRILQEDPNTLGEVDWGARVRSFGRLSAGGSNTNRQIALDIILVQEVGRMIKEISEGKIEPESFEPKNELEKISFNLAKEVVEKRQREEERRRQLDELSARRAEQAERDKGSVAQVTGEIRRLPETV